MSANFYTEFTEADGDASSFKKYRAYSTNPIMENTNHADKDAAGAVRAEIVYLRGDPSGVTQ